MVFKKTLRGLIAGTTLLGTLAFPNSSYADLKLIPDIDKLSSPARILYTGDATKEHKLRTEIGIGKTSCYSLYPIANQNCDKFRLSFLRDFEEGDGSFTIGYTIPRFHTGDLEHSIFAYAVSSDFSGFGFESRHKKNKNSKWDLTLNAETRTNDGRANHFGTEIGRRVRNTRFSFAYDRVGGVEGKQNQYLFTADSNLSNFLGEDYSLNTGVAIALRTHSREDNDKRIGHYLVFSSKKHDIGFSSKTHFKFNESDDLEKFDGLFVFAQNPTNNLYEFRRAIGRNVRGDERFSLEVIPPALDFRELNPINRSKEGFALTLETALKNKEFARFWQIGGALSYVLPFKVKDSAVGFSIGATHNSLESRLPGPFRVLPFGGNVKTIDAGIAYRFDGFSVEISAGVPVGNKKIIKDPFGEEKTFPPHLEFTLTYTPPLSRFF